MTTKRKTTKKLRGWMFEKHRQKCEYPKCRRWTEPHYITETTYCKEHEKIMDFFHKVIDDRISKFLRNESFRLDQIEK